MRLRLPKLNTYDLDDEIHRYTRDIQALTTVLDDMDADDANREQLEYNLKIMTLVQQRLLERHE